VAYRGDRRVAKLVGWGDVKEGDHLEDRAIVDNVKMDLWDVGWRGGA